MDALVSTNSLLIQDAPKKAVTCKGLSPLTTRLTRSLLENVIESFASWHATCIKLPSTTATSSQGLGCFSSSHWSKTYSFKKGMYFILLLDSSYHFFIY